MAAGSRIGRALRKVSSAGGTRPAKAVAARATKNAGKPAKKAAKTSAPAAKTAAGKASTAPAKKAPAKTAGPKTGRKATAKAAAKKAAPKKTAPAKKPAAHQAAPTKKAAPAKKGARPKKAPPAKKAAPAKQARLAAGAPARVSVPAGSDWTRAELTAIRAQLVDELAEMRTAYDRSLADLTELQLSSGDGAGDDQADAGSKTFEREQEQSIAANRLDLMTQMQHAVERIDAGTYGYCESCGRPIPKARLKAFPAATLDVACKEREERR
jgi:RNA polymerase-binding transcription factor DksA